MKKNESRFHYLKKTLLCFVLFLLLSFRIIQIWANPIDDFDTSSLILQVGEFKVGSNPGFFWVDIAHPGMLSVWIYISHVIYVLTDLPPIYIWSTLISLGLIFACIALFFTLKKQTYSTSTSLIASILYLSSPTIGDISSRSEENFLFHAFFIVAIYIVSSFLKSETHKKWLPIFAISLVLAAQHLQPFLIICGGLFLFFISELYRIKNDPLSRYKQALKALCIFSIPGFVYYFIVHNIFYDPSLVRSYAANFFSLFNNDSLFKYLKAFLLFAQGDLLTGVFPVQYWTNKGIEPKSIIYLLGMIVIFVTAWIAYFRKFIDFVTVTALGFVFLYEPSASERWDTFVIALIIAGAFHLNKFSTSPTTSTSFSNGLFISSCLALFLINIYSCFNQFNVLVTSLKVQNQIAKELNPSHPLYTNLDSGRIILKQLPRWLMIKNIDNSDPILGDAVYLKDGPMLIKRKLNLECNPTPIPDLCLIKN